MWERQLRGLGDAFCCGGNHIRGEAFAVLLGYMVMNTIKSAALQLAKVLEHVGSSVVLLEWAERGLLIRYGVICGEQIEGRLYGADDFVGML